MKIIYLAAYKAFHKNYNIIYQDINGKRDLPGDMLNIDLKKYDVIIATPPCNYYSKARGNKKPSLYAENTKHLLPGIIHKLENQDKPYIIENVRNYALMEKMGCFTGKSFVYFIGRHTYWTNIMFNPTTIKQIFDFNTGGYALVKNTQGGQNVHNVIDYWLETII